MENTKIGQEISDLLQKSIKDSIDNYHIILHEGNKIGEGFLGEMIVLSLKNKKTNQETHFIIKQAMFDTALLNNAFKFEINVYDIIWPKLIEFQKSFAPILKDMNLLPRCFSTNSQSSNKRIVLENLKCEKFEIYPKKKCFDKTHMELIFKTYGKLHALSFAIKEKEPESFKNFEELLKKPSDFFTTIDYALLGISSASRRIMDHYKEEYKTEIVNRMSKYATSAEAILSKYLFHIGDYPVLVHGDCWSNNMLFKYDENKNPIEMKLIDFQFSRLASPIQDLSFAFYSGTSKEMLNDLEHYLNIYYESLTNILKAFGYDSEVLYPFRILKDEWKEYSKLGFMFAILAWSSKLLVSNYPTIGNGKNIREVNKRHLIANCVELETYDRILNDLVFHMYTNNFI